METMTTTNSPNLPVANHWLLVLSLVGLDYFSTLAYLPSLAVAAAGNLAPLAALAVVLVTVCFALPAYAYVVGRSPDGRGAAGLLEKVLPGWGGKLLVLILLGFAAADFVITRSLSLADAATHVIHNSHGQAVLDQLSPISQWFQPLLGAERIAQLERFFPRQVIITVGLTLLSLAFWQLLQKGFTRRILYLAAAVVAIYLTIIGIVVGSGLMYLFAHPELCREWWNSVEVCSHGGSIDKHLLLCVLSLALLALWAFPQLALGLSGFELAMTVSPLVGGGTRNTRKLLCAAVAIMCLFLLGSVFVTTLLVPRTALATGGLAEDRGLAYLAHGGLLTNGESATALNSGFGNAFGSLYYLVTIVILSLAGASVVMGLREMLPHYLHRLGMALTWAGQTGVIMHLLNAIIFVVTLVFNASLSAQQWAYATSVLVLLAGATLAAGVDLYRRGRLSSLRWFAASFGVMCGFFLLMTTVTVFRNSSGVIIALTFVMTIVVTSFISRWLRSTELRFEGFSFSDEATRMRWDAICQREFQVVAPHRPGLISVAEKSREIQRDFRLSSSTPVLFVEATLGDPSEFYQQPRIEIIDEQGLEVVRVSKCVSISHVLASLCLSLCSTAGRPPEIIFGWSNERPLAANLNFLLLGQGNIPWMVKELVRRAVPDVDRQPRVHIG
jgi:hypothetical protein